MVLGKLISLLECRLNQYVKHLTFCHMISAQNLSQENGENEPITSFEFGGTTPKPLSP